MTVQRTLPSLLVGLAALMGSSASQAAPVQFASFNQMAGDTAKPFTYANNGNSGVTAAAGFSNAPNTLVAFSFNGGNVPGAPTGVFTAAVVIGGTTTSPVLNIGGPGGTDLETVSFSISFIDTVSGKNLLTATLNGRLSGDDGGFSASLNSSTVTYTSDYLDFTGTSTRILTFQFNPTNSALGINGNGLFNSFSGTGSGQFSSDPPPVITTTGTVPEPASVVLMGLGLVGVLGVARSRRKGA